MDSRRSTAVQFFVEDDNNKVSCTSVTSCMSEVTCGNVSVFNIRFFYETEEDGSVSNTKEFHSRLLYFTRGQDTDYSHLRFMAVCPIPSRLTRGGTINWATIASLNILSLDQILLHETKILIQFCFIHIFNLLFSVSNSHVKLTLNKQMHI